MQLPKFPLAVYLAGGGMGLDLFVHASGGHALAVIGLDAEDLLNAPWLIVLNCIAHSSFFVAFVWIAWQSWQKQKRWRA